MPIRSLLAFLEVPDNGRGNLEVGNFMYLKFISGTVNNRSMNLISRVEIIEFFYNLTRL